MVSSFCTVLHPAAYTHTHTLTGTRLNILSRSKSHFSLIAVCRMVSFPFCGPIYPCWAWCSGSSFLFPTISRGFYFLPFISPHSTRVVFRRWTGSTSFPGNAERLSSLPINDIHLRSPFSTTGPDVPIPMRHMGHKCVCVYKCGGKRKNYSMDRSAGVLLFARLSPSDNGIS